MDNNKDITLTSYKPSISVIVPVYKVEPYLRSCIDSILVQTFTDFDLILVDDGSPDNCGTICDGYAAMDDRITVIHQENKGLSAARNAGIDWAFENSTSEWITFVDSDDMLFPTCLETMYRYATETDADTLVAQGREFSNETELASVSQEVHSVKCMSGRSSCISCYTAKDSVSIYAWGKLYRKRLFLHERYPVGKQFEDEALTPKILYISSNVTILHTTVYCYRIREDSIVHVPFSLRRYDHLEGMDSCIQFFEANNEQEIARLARNKKIRHTAKYALLAHGAGLSTQIPAEYQMPVWKATCITFADTLKRGGIRFILVRVRQFFKRIKH